MKMKALEKFFSEYAAASMGNDANRVAKFYASNFIAAAKDKSTAFSNDNKFIDWLNELFQFNKKVGLQQMTVKKVEASPISEFFLEVTVTWMAVFAKKPTEQINFDIHYILNHTGNDYKIVLYISEEDQEELMKEKGVL
jgi:hypothetical protein